jgi:hypothetical protein
MVPESKQLVSGIENRIYIACATPDGSPLKRADLAITTDQNQAPIHVTTDSLGMATYAFVPKTPSLNVSVRATTPDGHSASASQAMSATQGQDGVLLRPDKTLAKVGESLNLSAFSSIKSGTFYIDVIRNKQTILTRAQASINGQAAIRIPLTNAMVGTLEVNAYKILPNEQIVRDTKTIVVSPADDLTINVTTDRPQYRPGEEALVRFAVKNLRCPKCSPGWRRSTSRWSAS